jgi:hypothetical protein
MRRIFWAALVGAALSTATASSARAQVFGGGYSAYHGFGSYYGAPGYYGVSYGYPSYGLTRTYSVFTTPYGPGYGYGYDPYAFLPGRYGVGLYRPGFAAPGYVYGASYYRTFPVPLRPLVPSYPPAVGYYAPGFGPPIYPGW